MLEAPADLDFLRDKHRRVRNLNSPDLNLRTHRAISWLTRAASLLNEDPDASFIFCWIAFNAAYAKDMDDGTVSAARNDFQNFFERLVNCDTEERISHEIWYQYKGLVSELLDNKFIFSPFWKFHNGDDRYANWKTRFENSKKVAAYAIEDKETSKILSVIFDRLYVLRNQLVHGGATWNSQVNRKQVRNGAELLIALIPIFVDTMMSNSNEEWGAPYYPVIE
jgi:hypothetical protein